MAELKSTLPETTENRDWLSRPLSLALQIDWEKALYITMIIIGIITRFWGLGDRVVSHDESLHTQYSYQYYNGDGYNHTPLMHGPFLFHVTAFSYWLFGHNDFTARIPVAILGVFLIIMPYYLRDWLGRKGALFASFIFLISPYVVYYSRYIRHDVPSIVWALIVFIGTWYYLRDGFEKSEKSLWWFALGLALLFSTKEVSFIYVAIFGSFLVYRLLAQIVYQPWFKRNLGDLIMPMLVVAFGVALAGGGFVGKWYLENRAEALSGQTTEQENQGPDSFAADPTAEITFDESTNSAAGITAMRWVQIVGLISASMGLFLVANAWRPYLEKFPEFDLIILYATLILPMVAPLLVVMAGWNPLDYNFNRCVIEGQELMGPLQEFFTKLFNGQCWSVLFSSGIMKTTLFLFPMAVVSIAVGLWWRSRTWVICAAIYHITFFLLYTSVFTNPGGWASGTIGSLGYWLEQQEVQRGSQPWFYYAIVTPLYEFLPLIFTFAAIRLWAIKERIHQVTGYWFWAAVVAALGYSYVNWIYNRNYTLPGAESSSMPGIVTAVIVLLLFAAFWFFVRYPRIKREVKLPTLEKLILNEGITGFVPSLIWWFVLTIIAYSYAGEKMPWLSIHFVIPMAFLVGWYFNERLKEVDFETLFSRRALLLLGVTAVFLITLFLALEPLFKGEVAFGSQTTAALNHNGRFLGSLLLALGLGYAMLNLSGFEMPSSGSVISKVPTFFQSIATLFTHEGNPLFSRAWLFAVFGLLSLLTIRFTYMANFPNADLSTEYMVYAHGAPSTKEEIMPQIEELSMRLYGDNSIQIVYDNESSWPYTWYLRNFPNRKFVGENPSPDIRDAPVLIIGNSNWTKFEPYLRNEYDYQTYTYLWWPMEDYRQISWEAILGDPDQPTAEERQEMITNGADPSTLRVRRGLGNPDVRAGLWDIFFYRDYGAYGEAFSKTFDLGQWPLRDELRLYIRRDVRSSLWDYGVGTFNVELPTDPYAEKELAPVPQLVIGDGELNTPRNAAVGPDGRLYVADSGNHRIAVFEDGVLVNSFGQFGALEGEFNEPWGLAVDDEFVYVADTWNHRLQKFTLEGEFVAVLGQSGSIDPNSAASGGGLFFGPRDIALLSDNRLAITDTGNHRIQIFDRDGNFLQAFGGLGPLAGQFFEPVGLESRPDGMLYVADTWNARIQMINTSQGYVPTFEWEVVNTWESQSIENKPYIASDSNGRLYVTDPEGYRVLIFEADGTYAGRFGQYSPDSSGFGLPNGITIDAQDNIYVVDSANSHVLMFEPLLNTSAAPPSDNEVEMEPVEPAADVEEEAESDTAVEPAAGEETEENTETENEGAEPTET
ncbi:MAG: TIGR03663 family protein, partial [Anaerolineales bacterium]|nr:TIGR03663 family protein [Anaerolineales bacterium]